MTLGFEDSGFRGTWSYPFAQDLLKQARTIHTMEMKG